MKWIILRLVLALAAFTVVPDALAADSGSGNFFVDAKFGDTFGGSGSEHSAYLSDAQSAWGADGGYGWKLDDARSQGFDVGYMHFGHVADDPDSNGFFSETVSASAITLGGHFQYLFGADKASIFQARIGLMSVKLDSSFPPGKLTTTGSDSSRQTGAYLGLGIGRQITQSFSLVLALDGYDATGLDVEFLGLGAEYRF